MCEEHRCTLRSTLPLHHDSLPAPPPPCGCLSNCPPQAVVSPNGTTIIRQAVAVAANTTAAVNDLVLLVLGFDASWTAACALMEQRWWDAFNSTATRSSSAGVGGEWVLPVLPQCGPALLLQPVVRAPCPNPHSLRPPIPCELPAPSQPLLAIPCELPAPS